MNSSTYSQDHNESKSSKKELHLHLRENDLNRILSYSMSYASEWENRNV